ncbi:MAG: ADOP family duplicated permease [Gemmatimonas sp.]
MRYRLRVDRLQHTLNESRLSQNHWAIRLGFSRGHWSDIVNGKHPYPSAKTRERMVEVLGISFEALFEPDQGLMNSPDVEFRAALADRYIIDRELGQGAMGVVYLARDVAHGRLVALKQLSAEAVSGVGVTAFLREISVLARLQHPNILPLFAAGAAADHPYFVMPWVRQGSLRDRIKRETRMPLGDVQRIVKGLSAALGYAHAEHVLHCDIKPENILLHGDHAWLSDFGVSRILHAEASEWRAKNTVDISAGTPAYVSPEQANGEEHLDGRADVYSLGCVAYEMLTGSAPFEGETTEIVVSKRFFATAAPVTDYAPELNRAVASAVSHAMEVKREHRTATPEAFSAALEIANTRVSKLEHWIGKGSRAISRTTGAVRINMGKKPAYAFAGNFALRFADIRSAFRQARRAPVLTAIVVATLAIAIAVTTATYTLVDHVLLRPLPFASPDRLVSLTSADSVGNDVVVVSTANWLDWARSNTTLQSSAIYAERRVALRDGETATRVNSADVSAGFFQVVRPRFLFGRSFTQAEVDAGSAGVVVSEHLFRTMLGSDSTLRTPLRGVSRNLEVVGVVANGYEFPAGQDLWIAMRTPPEPSGTRNNINWSAIARLKEGVSMAQAKSDLGRVSRDIRTSDPTALYAYGVGVHSLQSTIVGDASNYLKMLLGAGAFVLLIACANVAAANIGRGTARAREFAVRVAIGAGRGRLFAQLLTEHITIACVGGALGIALAWVALRGMMIAWGNQIPRASEVHLDVRVLVIATVITMFSGLLSGVLPALLASNSPAVGLMGTGSRGAARGGRNIPGAVLVATQIAIAMVLVCGSTLLLRSFQALISRDLGYSVNVATAEATLTGSTFRGDTARQFAYWSELRRNLRAIAGVTHVGVANWTPLSMGGTGSIEIQERPEPKIPTSFRVVSDDYLEALGVPLIAGRMINASDNEAGEKVAIISLAVAKHFWPNESAIGKVVRSPSMEQTYSKAGAPWRTVIGVVGDVRHWGFEHDVDAEIYVPYRQVATYWVANMTAVVSSARPIQQLLTTVSSTAKSVNRDVAVDVGTMETRAHDNTATRRMVVTLLTAFGTLALLLAALGTYGLLAYGVAQRGREMAIRSALGATRSQLMRLIFGGVGRIVLAGISVGVASAFALTQVIESQLVDVSRTDNFAFGLSVAVVVLSAMLATWVPARRAGKADPTDSLRGD